MIANPKTSLYCWLVLLTFIAATLIFMVNFYNRAVTEITANYQNRQQVIARNLKDL